MPFIKLHKHNNNEILVNTDNITYIENKCIYFNFASNDSSYNESCDCLCVKESFDEIAEIINNAIRPVSSNPNLLQKS